MPEINGHGSDGPDMLTDLALKPAEQWEAMSIVDRNRWLDEYAALGGFFALDADTREQLDDSNVVEVNPDAPPPGHRLTGAHSDRRWCEGCREWVTIPHP